jgi:hypothetical protein
MCLFAANAYAVSYTVVSAGWVDVAGVQLILDDGVDTITAYAKHDAAFENMALAIALTAKASSLKIEIGSWSGGKFGTIRLVNP